MATTLPNSGGLLLADTGETTYNSTFGAMNNAALVYLGNENATKTVAQSFADFALSRAKLIDTSETAYSVGNVSGAVTIDYTNGHWQYATVTGNITSLTISNPPATGTGGWLTLELLQDGTGSRTIALTSTYKTAGAAGITLSTTASSKDLLHLTTRDAGTTWLARIEKAFA